MPLQQKILLVGYGKMGSALHARWKQNSTHDVFVLDPFSPTAYHDAKQLPVKHFNIIILAVKPQVMDAALAELTPHVTTSLYVSIAAGKTLPYLEDVLPDSQAIVRTMPNTPAMIGKGMTVGCANRPVTDAQKQIVKALFENVGQFEWLEDESLMDAVTAVSGSGPAYLFLLIEEMTKAGIAQGLPPDMAMKLARQTVIGSAALAENQSTVSASELRTNVTSPGGTTEAALQVLMSDNKFGKLMDQAIEAAVKRGRDLA